MILGEIAEESGTTNYEPSKRRTGSLVDAEKLILVASGI